MIDLNLTQEVFAETRVGCRRSTISNFLNGKPVARDIFIRACEILKLDWQEITGLKKSSTDKQQTEIDIDALVNQLRKQVKADIENRCGTMRILDMTQPIGLSHIYTQVNILEKILGRRRKEIAELQRDCNLEDFDRFGLGKVTEAKIPAQDAVTKYRKLLILGKPGAGKTTFLKHLAIQCNNGQFQGDLVPFFVTLKDFAESGINLLSYLNCFLSSIKESSLEDLKQVLGSGKALILLDGLDEVLEADSDRVLREVREFSTDFHNNRYVMTCRIAAKEYTFEQFTEVEIADFDWQQITTFANNWFKNKAIKPETFLDRIKEDKPIQELASNPLLLTLLCLAFEESGDFPHNRARLYKEGLDALLKKWDAKRGIKRDKVYQKLWLQRKEALLSKIAWDTFAPGEYFFKQEVAEKYISEYIRNLPGASIDEEALQLDSEVVLKSIEAQHGLLVARAKHIYSFSHLTFHEYFTAREIVIVRQSAEAALPELVSHIFEKRWREVFLLVVAMSDNADRLVLLMKEKIDISVARDEKIQEFLQWLNVRISKLNSKSATELILQVKETKETGDFYVEINVSPSRGVSLYLNISELLKIAKKGNSILYQRMEKFYNRYYNLSPSNKIIQTGKFILQNKLASFLEKMLFKYFNITHNWQFDGEQKTLLIQYYRANQLLAQCLHQECYVSREVRQEIEETLLLPMAEIDRRRQVIRT
ncbi:NACHT C-terminal helical domain 2-containing protein [Merismopedia glauca]|uniref:NACHT C-terminal helical domain 2-containing protein n=1 Tax=Merismopedia glauca TaxID=292586 RepID=UPI001FEA64D4|nr:NACHT domain-containing protein [Merismopedia glauca]